MEKIQRRTVIRGPGNVTYEGGANGFSSKIKKQGLGGGGGGGGVA